MRALILDDAGELRLDPAYPDPAPGADEALIRVTLAGVCNTDLELAKGYMNHRGALGHEFVGVVESARARRLTGKRVVGEINCPCGECAMCRRGLGRHCPRRSVLGILGRDGAFADYVTLPTDNLHCVPDSISDTAAAFTEPLAAAFEITRQIRLGPGMEVALLGDGKLGMLIGQVVGATGCSLTVAGRHPERLAFLEKQGAITKRESEMINARSRFDVVIDATGSPHGLASAAELVRPCGTIVLKTTVSGPSGFDMNRLVIDEITLIGSRCGPFDVALGALEKGSVDTEPLISDILPLDDGIEAMRRASDNENLKILLEMTR